MLILGGCLAVVALGGVLYKFADWDTATEFCGFMLLVFGATACLGAGGTLITMHLEAAAQRARLHALQETLTAARESGRTLESAAFQLRVAEANEWIAEAQFWNDSALDIWVPDWVDALEPIR